MELKPDKLFVITKTNKKGETKALSLSNGWTTTVRQTWFFDTRANAKLAANDNNMAPDTYNILPVSLTAVTLE